MITKTSALSLFLSIATTNPSSTTAFLPTSLSPLSSTSRIHSELDAKKKIFIDGEAGTTGLQVRDRLAGREDLEIISISDDLRKDAKERKRLINEADCVILCELMWCLGKQCF
jgi:N-acetyl-gamma-glutamyl-phosphate reductase